MATRALPAVVPRCVAQWLPHRFRAELAKLLLEPCSAQLLKEPLDSCDPLLVTLRGKAAGDKLRPSPPFLELQLLRTTWRTGTSRHAILSNEAHFELLLDENVALQLDSREPVDHVLLRVA